MKVSESCTLGRKSKVGASAWGEKSGLHCKKREVSKSRRSSCKENLPRRIRKKHEWVSERKSSPGGSGESWFYSKSGQI